MKWSGERFVPGLQSETTLAHLHRYGFAMQFATGKRVLDIACGEGYGASLLSQVAASVCGVDIDPETVAHASRTYRASGLRFCVGAADAIPLASGSIDVVVSYETIEHHDRHREMIMECKRVLAPGGVLVISSPDKKHYSEETGFINPYHVKELYREEFLELLRAEFSCVVPFDQRTLLASVIAPSDGAGAFAQYHGTPSVVSKQPQLGRPQFVICLASDSALSCREVSVFDGSDVSNELQRAARLDIERIYSSGIYQVGRFVTLPIRLFVRVICKSWVRDE